MPVFSGSKIRTNRSIFSPYAPFLAGDDAGAPRAVFPDRLKLMEETPDYAETFRTLPVPEDEEEEEDDDADEVVVSVEASNELSPPPPP